MLVAGGPIIATADSIGDGLFREVAERTTRMNVLNAAIAARITPSAARTRHEATLCVPYAAIT